MGDFSLYYNNPTFRRNFLAICVAASNGKVLRDMKNIFYGRLSAQKVQEATHKRIKENKANREKIIAQRFGKTFSVAREMKKEQERIIASSKRNEEITGIWFDEEKEITKEQWERLYLGRYIIAVDPASGKDECVRARVQNGKVIEIINDPAEI